MYILIFFIVLGITTYVINKMNNVDSSEEFLKWDRRDLFILLGTFLLACLLQALDFILPKIIWIVYLFIASIAMVLVNKNREKYVQQYKAQLEQIFEAVKLLVTEKELDYNNLPFEVHKDGDQIDKITVKMSDPKKFNDGNCTNSVYSLKNYFPYYDWHYSNDFPKQICEFEGQALPPEIANWPGSDLRVSAFIPVGVSGDGEVGLNIGAKDMGKSSYVFEDSGELAESVKLPSAPQGLVIGSTGGGKSIWVEQEIW